eukprot:710235_1
MCCLRTNWRAHSIQSTHLSLIYQTRLEIKIEEQTTADQGNQLCELKQAFEDERRAKEADDLVISKHKRILIKWKMDWRIWTMFLTLNKARKRHEILHIPMLGIMDQNKSKNDVESEKERKQRLKRMAA